MKKRMNLLLVLSIITFMLITTAQISNSLGVQIEDKNTNDNDLQRSYNLMDQSKLKEFYDISSTSDGYAKISQIDVDFGNAYRIHRDGSILYVAGKTGGVTFIDVSNPNNPEVLGNYLTSGPVYDAVYRNSYCYIASPTAGLEILDVSDWNDITSVNSTYDGGESYDLEFLGLNTLYVADGTGGLDIYSFRDSRTTFNKINSYDFASYGISEVISVETDPLNNIGFLMCGTDGVVVLDTTLPFTPEVLDVLEDGSTDSQHADISTPYLYVADGANGLKVYDYGTDQNNITLVGTFSIGVGEYASFFEWDVNQKGYLSTGSGGYLYLLNITNLTSITSRWKKAYTPGESYDIELNSRILYLANDYDLKILDLTDVNNPVEKSNVIFAAEPSATEVKGTLGILSEGLTGIDIINLTDIINPTLISKYNREDVRFYDSKINGSYIFSATNLGLEIINITDVNNPVIISYLDIGGARALEVKGETVYLASITGGLQTVNVTDLENPVELDSAGIAYAGIDLTINDNYAFVSTTNKDFVIIDISNPSSLSTIDTYSFASGVDGLFVNDTVLAVAALESGVLLYDITNINSLAFLDSEMTSGYNVTKVFIESSTIFVTARADGTFGIEASDPSNLGGIIGYHDDDGESVNLHVNNSIIFVADSTDSFEILDEDDDLDRLPNYVETNFYLTNYTLNDTDADGLLDGDEVDYWTNRDVDPKSDFDGDALTNILDIDSDNDTIIDGDEVNIWNSDPINFDSDDDNLLDKDEVNTYNTHPAFADTDSDDVNDYLEVLGLNATILYGGNPGANETGWLNGQIDGGLNASNPDTDGDTPWDGWELNYGFNPLVADSQFDNDTDLLNATMEFLYGSDPFNADTDGDGLTDGEEVITHGTDPTKEDTDGDGIPDNYEIDEGLDPLDNSDSEEDQDADGLTNYEEYYWGTDPTNNDTDGDSLPDEWEVYQGTNPLVNDTALDYDNDGLTNLEEYQYGTDPNDPDSDDDGFMDSTEIDAGTDPNDPNDYPERITSTPTMGLEFLAILGLVSLIGLSYLFIRKRK